MIRLKKIALPLLLVIILAAFLRLYKLNTDPPSLFGDELDVGYQAYSLLKTGRDLDNNFLPLYLRSLSEYRAPLYIYSAVPFVGVFGLNEWGVRLPAVFWGLLSIVGLYLLASELFSNKVGFIAAFLLSISPWHLQYSRASFEVTMLLTFLTFGIYLFIKAIKKPSFFIPAILLFSLTPYIYSTAAVFTPLIFITLLLIFRKDLFGGSYLKRNGVTILLTAAVFMVIIFPFTKSLVSGEAQNRFGLISIFQDTVLLDKINIARKGEDYYTPDGVKGTLSPVYERLFSNKPVIFGQVFALNYFRAFSFDFLFSQGDPNFRQSIFEMGELYIFEVVTILLGLFYLLTQTEKRTKTLVLAWLLLSPIPAVLTQDGGHHATRLFIMLPPLVILDALGAVWLLSKLKVRRHQIIASLIGILALANLVFYLQRYYLHYPIESWRWWQIGYKEAFSYVLDHQNQYNQIVVNNSYEPSLIRYLFYSRYDPGLFHTQFTGDQSKPNILSNIDGFTLGNKYFFGEAQKDYRNGTGFEKVMKPGMLYLASSRDEIPDDIRTYNHKNYTVLKTIVDPVGNPIFYILAGK